MLHIITLVFFTVLLLYSIFMSETIMEGLEGGCGSNPVANTVAIENINQQLNSLKDVKIRVDNIDSQTKKNTDGLKQMSEQLSKAGTAALGDFSKDAEITGL
jgi:hypothetical protein